MVITYKEARYTFQDLEPEVGKPTHLALDPINRVPVRDRAKLERSRAVPQDRAVRVRAKSLLFSTGG